MKKLSKLIFFTFFASLLTHYFFINFLPIRWVNTLTLFGQQQTNQPEADAPSLNINFIEGEFSLGDPLEKSSESSNKPKGSSPGSAGQAGEDEWADLMQSLEDNTGFSSDFEKTYDDIISNGSVKDGYIYRDRHHEDIVIKEVFPTVYDIEKPFEDIIEESSLRLDQYKRRNEIIEQYRSQKQEIKTELLVTLLSNETQKNLGPLDFPPESRQKFFDSTLQVSKEKQLSDFIGQYFQYDPDKGDLPITVREFYTNNLERLVYTFSGDRNYFYLDFYLENLNKEDFLHHALSQAGELQGTKTSTELLLVIERLYEIQQRAWANYFEFDKKFDKLPADKKLSLRVETLRRVNEKYKNILNEKGFTEFSSLEEKYQEKRQEILSYIIANTPDNYRMHDALFEQAEVLWQIGLKKNDTAKKNQAIEQWSYLINLADKNDLLPSEKENFLNLKYLPILDEKLRAYTQAPIDGRAKYERKINLYLKQRPIKRLQRKREREAKLLWDE